MEFIIKNGTSNELDLALDLLYQAAIWLKDKNIDYWQRWLNPSETYVSWIKQGFDKGEFSFVYNKDNHLIGMYRLQYSDEIFWGKRNDKAGYIHSFTTNRGYRGKGMGYLILKAVEDELIRNNFDYLRLDCSPDIDGLCKYYENYGFEPKEVVEIQDFKVRLYEKKLHTPSNSPNQ